MLLLSCQNYICFGYTFQMFIALWCINNVNASHLLTFLYLTRSAVNKYISSIKLQKIYRHTNTLKLKGKVPDNLNKSMTKFFFLFSFFITSRTVLFRKVMHVTILISLQLLWHLNIENSPDRFVTVLIFHFELTNDKDHSFFGLWSSCANFQPFRVVEEQGNYHVILHTITW